MYKQENSISRPSGTRVKRALCDITRVCRVALKDQSIVYQVAGSLKWSILSNRSFSTATLWHLSIYRSFNCSPVISLTEIQYIEVYFKYTSSILSMYFPEKKYTWSILHLNFKKKSINEVHLVNVLHLYFKSWSILQVYLCRLLCL